MQYVVDRFSIPGQLVFDLVSGAFQTTTACSKLSWRRHFVSYEVDSVCVAENTKAIVVTYARQIMNKKSDMFVSDEVVEACKIVVHAPD